MRRLVLLLLIPLLISCERSIDVAPLPTSTVESAPSTSIPPITITDTLFPTNKPPAETPIPLPDATAFPDPNQYVWQLVASGLDRPVDLQSNGSGRLFVVEKLGHIHIIENGQWIETPFLNIEDRVNNGFNEMGLLGLAFHPGFSANGYFYVNYTGRGGDTFISRFRISDNPYVADNASETIILNVKQPFPNHNGGALAFGNDGFLYAGLGDGGGAGDPFENGQKVDVLLGKVLRLDVDSASPYAIPLDNPFGNEVWAYGLRNPWRMSFDRQTGNLFIGDVGQWNWEEIDLITPDSRKGLNFGWDHYEGNHEYQSPGGAGKYVFPIAEYNHNGGHCSVTGGFVYRGSMAEWNGIYLYGDYCSGNVWGLLLSGDTWQNQLLFDTDARITSFGRDDANEIYLVSDGGQVYKLVRQ